MKKKPQQSFKMNSMSMTLFLPSFAGIRAPTLQYLPESCKGFLEGVAWRSETQVSWFPIDSELLLSPCSALLPYPKATSVFPHCLSIPGGVWPSAGAAATSPPNTGYKAAIGTLYINTYTVQS